MASAVPQRPKISAILLSFNHETYIQEALDGLLGQTYEPLEIIVLDDCSTDRSPELIQNKLSDYRGSASIRFVRNGRNMVHPVPVVLPLVSGSFIVISSGDDVMLPTMIEEMAAVWLQDDVSLVTANAFYIDENSSSLDRTFRAPDAPADESFETLARDGANACCFGAAMGFDRAIYDMFGWPPTDFLQAGDIVLPFYAYLLKGARFINKPLLKYRVHSGNSSLSLLAERSSDEDRLRADELSYTNHLNHAVFFYEELDRLRSEEPGRYTQVADRALPLLTTQITEMAKKLVRTRRDLHRLRLQASGLGQNS